MTAALPTARVPAGSEKVMSARTEGTLDRDSGNWRCCLVPRRQRPRRMATDENEAHPGVCVVIPVRNRGKYLGECLASVIAQDYPRHKLCVSIYNDGSNDPVVYDTLATYQPLLRRARIETIIQHGEPCENQHALGVGGARNEAVRACPAKILVFCDADDVMSPDRVSKQVALLKSEGAMTVVGGNFVRIPEDATPRYVEYHQSLQNDDTQLFRHAFRDMPLAMPTIACHRVTWERVGGFVAGRGVSEDMHFIYKHLGLSGRLAKVVGPPIVRYRYHLEMTSLELDRRELLQVRVQAFEKLILDDEWRNHASFMVWGAGRDGRAFFRFLSEKGRKRVSAFVDVDLKKIGKICHGKPVLPITDVKAPFVTCVALNRTKGAFEAKLAETGYCLGIHYYYLV